MYSKEKKEIALKVFHQTESISETIQILGYPTRRQLYNWIATENTPAVPNRIVMHKYGCYSKEAKEVICDLEKTVEQMSSKLKNTLLIITADHGHVDGKNVAISYAQKTLIWTNAFLNGLNYVCVAFSGYQYTKKESKMKQLFSIDLKDYHENDAVFRRPSARAIILKGHVIALVYSGKENYYKFPGGGIKEGEDMSAALIREVKEEVGLIVKLETITEFGSVLRRQKSDHTKNTIFEQENFYFKCECEENVVLQNLDDYEKEAEFTLKYVDIDEAIKVNSEYKSKDFFNEIMIQREKRVLEMIKESLI